MLKEKLIKNVIFRHSGAEQKIKDLLEKIDQLKVSFFVIINIDFRRTKDNFSIFKVCEY